jgi:hypothetical protein
MTKTEFIDWKTSYSTQEVFSLLSERVQRIQEILGESAGQDSTQDAKYVGAIKAYNDMLNIDFEETVSK